MLGAAAPAAGAPAVQIVIASVLACGVSAVLIALVAYETIRFAELRERVRHELAQPGGAA